MFDAMQSRGAEGEASGDRRGVWGAARSPNEGDGRGKVQSMDFWGTISGDCRGWVDRIYDNFSM